MDCTIRVAKTEALISCAVTAQLICVFVFAYAKSRFSYNEAQINGVVQLEKSNRKAMNSNWSNQKAKRKLQIKSMSLNRNT